MKNIALTFVAALAVLTMMAQPPQEINYQGVARDNSGVILATQPIGLRITIHQTTATGPTVYQETHSTSTNQFGLFNISVGSGTVVSGSFSGIDWGADRYFTEVEMDETGGISYQSMGTSQMLSVPYALYAETSGGINNSFGVESFLYPQGIDGIPIAFELDTNVSYTIPSDKNLYLTSCGLGGAGISNNGVPCGVDGFCPMFPPNSVLYGTSGFLGGGFTGTLIDTTNNITPVYFALNNTTDTYTVPSGKLLIIRSGNGQGGSLTRNGVPYYNGSQVGGAVWLMPSGSLLGTIISTSYLFTGYLVDE